MPSFRSTREQAHHAVTTKIALGQSRHGAKNDGKIKSLGQARNFEQNLTGFGTFCLANRLAPDLQSATPEHAQMYLAERQEAGWSQKTLDGDRQALQCHFQQKFDRVQSLMETSHGTRSYTPAQIREIVAHQSPRNSLATEIAYTAGLRAHELLTIRPAEARAASPHRHWSAERFCGRDGVKYTVCGKGGLVREVLIPRDLSVRLEATKWPRGPVQVTDRGIRYKSLYRIGGGRNWSTSFTRVAQTRLGYSSGGHGVRHSYAQERMSELQGNRFAYAKALGIVAQELGHFAPKTSEAYLR